ncbi:MAG: DNRLRE domain-containing protein, partial [Bacteroidota bacterium]
MKRNLRVLFIVFSSLFIVNSNAQDTLSIELGTGYIKDAYINIVNNFSNGDSEGLVAAVWTYYGEYGMGRSLIGFDFSGLRENMVVIDARLNLYHNPTTGHIGHSTLGGENSGMIFRITQPWDEHLVNWVNQPPTTNTNAIFIPAPDNDTSDFLNVDITPIIADMIRHPKTSDGFMIKLFSEDSLYRSLTFASSDHPQDSLHPTIIITYIVDLPLDSSQTMQPDEETGKDTYISSIGSYSKENEQSLVSTVWEFEQGWGIGRSFLEF